MAFIYVITNDVNGKQYVGKTLHNSIEKRFREHLRDYRRKSRMVRPLYSAMNKYGKEHFSIKVLEADVDPDLLSEREKYWIEYLDTYHHGYNATKGGDGHQIYDYSEIKNLVLKGFSTKEISDKLGCSKNIIYSVKRLYKINKSTNKWNNSIKKPIDQLDLSGNLLRVFDSAYSTGKWLVDNGYSSSKFAYNSVRDCIKERKPTAYGFRWRFHNKSDRPSHN